MTTTTIIPFDRTVTIETHIHIIKCARCSMDFGIGEDFQRRRREDHGHFYCPNGHSNVYNGDNTEAKLRKQLEEQKRRTEQAQDYTERERRQRLLAERQRAAAKGQVTKIKNRVGNGVCPCCNRSFQNVAKHMAGQHPDFAGDPS